MEIDCFVLPECTIFFSSLMQAQFDRSIAVASCHLLLLEIYDGVFDWECEIMSHHERRSQCERGHIKVIH